ncbi:MAG: hypothetical protein EOP51_09420 [Sphingobacteriales bacterium]|nr:MAG: hypothetical protein EOP51_09420 [Sphingobacteriales bacterium]
MKKVALLCLLGIGLTVGARAQSFELGIGGGFSTNTSPSGNMKYQTDQSVVNYAGTLKLIYTSASNFQIGLDGSLVELSGKSSKKYKHFQLPDSIGGDGKKFVYAKYAPAICLIGNKLLPINKSAIYIGLAAGYGFARNQTDIMKSNESYKGQDGGHGLVLGGQIGYLGTLSEKLALNIEVAIRSYNLKFDGPAPYVTPQEKLHYGTVAIPITIGIRYYFFKYDNARVPRPYRVRPVGRSMY